MSGAQNWPPKLLIGHQNLNICMLDRKVFAYEFPYNQVTPWDFNLYVIECITTELIHLKSEHMFEHNIVNIIYFDIIFLSV